jgi:hypothetical protein
MLETYQQYSKLPDGRTSFQASFYLARILCQRQMGDLIPVTCLRIMCHCNYCVLYCLYCVFVLFRLGVFIFICY